MRAKLVMVIGLIVVLFLAPGALYAKSSYFGVPNKAVVVPKEFDETEAAIEKAERSPGAQVCPDKIAKARELAKKGVETYWACRDKEAMALLAEARKLAQEAEVCMRGAIPAPSAEAVQPKEIIILRGVAFALNSAELTPRSTAVLDEHVAKLKADPNIRVRVAGHTCSLGSDAYNQRLSERRATAVMNYFIAQGIAPDRLEAVGYGETNPIASNDTEEGRSKNRRVELHIF